LVRELYTAGFCVLLLPLLYNKNLFLNYFEIFKIILFMSILIIVKGYKKEPCFVFKVKVTITNSTIHLPFQILCFMTWNYVFVYFKINSKRVLRIVYHYCSYDEQWTHLSAPSCILKTIIINEYWGICIITIPQNCIIFTY